MPLTDFITLESVLPNLRAGSKKLALHELARAAAHAVGAGEREVFEGALQRERLGSTGIGGGIAIPHCKLPGLARLAGAFARLERPIDFEALDGAPVDLVFLLVAPEAAGADHLKALARVARAFRDGALAARLRATRDGPTLYALLAQGGAGNGAGPAGGTTA